MRNRHVTFGNCDNFVIPFSLINHSHHSNYFSLHQTHRLDTDTAKDQNIQRILIITVSLRYETIIVRVVYCTEEDSV
jgi:hypothetical protein